MLAPHARYKFKPFFGSSHTWAMERISRLSGLNCALDIGSGSGLMGGFLKELGVREVQAVEPDTESRSSTAHLYDRMTGSLEELDAGKKFDLILLLDVLEHTAEPFSYFEKITRLMAPQGRLLLSLPNIAHWSVRLPLLFGVFNYTDRGILDKTHLQFFTRRRVLSLLASVQGLRCDELSSSIEPLEFLLPESVWDNPIFLGLSKLRLGIARALPGFFAYQHLAALSKGS